MSGKKKLSAPRKPKRMKLLDVRCTGCGGSAEVFLAGKDLPSLARLRTWLDKAIRYLEHKQQGEKK